jgi:predicted metal-dependent phosphotriesterase family hydrolase
VIPMLKWEGVDQTTIDEIIVENPKKVLTID